MIHERNIKREYGGNANVIRKGDSAWRNPDRVSPHSHEVSGEPGFRNPLSKMGQKLLQHSDPYRVHLDEVLDSLPEHEVDAMDEISVSVRASHRRNDCSASLICGTAGAASVPCARYQRRAARRLSCSRCRLRCHAAWRCPCSSGSARSARSR